MVIKAFDLGGLPIGQVHEGALRQIVMLAASCFDHGSDEEARQISKNQIRIRWTLARRSGPRHQEKAGGHSHFYFKQVQRGDRAYSSTAAIPF